VIVLKVLSSKVITV